MINGTCTGFKERNDDTDYNFYLPNEKADDNIVYVFDENNNQTLIRGICDKFTDNINPPTIIPITSQKIPRLTYDIKTKLEALKKYQQEGVASDKKKGGKSRNLLKVSDKRVMINGKSRVVYVGARNVEYIKIKNEFITLKSAIKQLNMNKNKLSQPLI